MTPVLARSFNGYNIMCLIQISSPKFDIEHGELLLYQNMVLREAGRPDKALDHLMEYEPLMHDKLVVREIKGMFKRFCLFKVNCNSSCSVAVASW